jgi:arylformamidase
MNLIDISPIISESLGVFPGDQKFSRTVSMDFARGDHLGLSAITTTLHLGAHTDAPLHYVAGGAGMSERSLDFYIGRCLVLEASAPRGVRIERKHFAPEWQSNDKWPAQRILVKTGSFPDPNRWNHDFNSFDPSLIELWGKSGIRLIGIDTPSIDPETSKGLESHQTVARYDMAILEGVVLSSATEGLYTLIAMPLKIQGADASPVRAVLIRDFSQLASV